jgi:hypothetical protein
LVQSKEKRRADLFFSVWSASALLLAFLLPKKFNDMNYYFIPFIVPFGYWASRGFAQMAALRGLRVPLLILYFLASFAFAEKIQRFIPEPELWALEAGRAVLSRTPEGARVIAVSGSSPLLLYSSGRKGWDRLPVSPEELADMKKHGAGYLVSTDTGLGAHAAPFLLERARVMEENERYALWELPT